MNRHAPIEHVQLGPDTGCRSTDSLLAAEAVCTQCKKRWITIALLALLSGAVCTLQPGTLADEPPKKASGSDIEDHEPLIEIGYAKDLHRFGISLPNDKLWAPKNGHTCKGLT